MEDGWSFKKHSGCGQSCQGTASSIAETWARFDTLDDARRAVKQMYHDDRVLRVLIVRDALPPQVVEWVER
jgi:hypothetical protein